MAPTGTEEIRPGWPGPTPSSRLNLILLGQPRLLCDGEDITSQIKYRKGMALLAYLAVNAGTWFTRESLSDLLWPELDLDAARTNLRQVLNNLAGLLNRSEELLKRTRTALTLAPGVELGLDIAALSEATLGRIASDTPEARLWREREFEPWTGHLSGEFMSCFQLANTPEFDAWLEAQRLHFVGRASVALELLCQIQQREGRLDAAIRTARQLVANAPLDEEHHLLLMSLLAETGNLRGALGVFETVEQRLRLELGVTPDQALLALSDSLKQRLHDRPSPLRDAEPEQRQMVALYCVSELIEADGEDEDFAAHFRSIVQRRGGEVVSALGRGLLAVFGRGPSAERAVHRALLSATDLLAAQRPDWPLPCIGISAGRVLLRSESAVPFVAGEMPDIAKLLGWSAEPGEILVSEPAAAQAGEWFRFEPLAERELPGIKGRHRPHLLLGAADAARADDRPLAGREQELAQLEAWWREATAGRPRLALLRAPAGFGKTRLAAGLARRVETLGGNVRYIQCSLEHQHEPLAPILAAFGPLQGGTQGAPLSKSDLFAAVSARLREEAEHEPTLLIVDDLHWSDRATLEFLVQIAYRLQAQRLMMVVTTRPEVAFDFPEAWGEVIELPPLEEAASRSMIALHDPENAIPEEERARIVRTCAGIPLFVERQVKSHVEGGHHHLSIAELLQNELDRLGADKYVLQAAALLGNRFQRSHLAALLPDADVATALSRAVDRQLIDAAPASAFVFRHALIHDAAYTGLPTSRRKRLHERGARILMGEANAAAEEIAHHLALAGCHHEAFDWWLKAGEAAMAAEFAADAVVSFQQALDQLALSGAAADPEQVRSVRMRLGYAAQVAEGYGSPLTHRLFTDMVAEIEALPNQEERQLFAALSGCYMGSSCFGKDEGIAIARRLHALADTDAERLMAYFALGNTLFWLGRFEEAAHWQRQCINLAAEVPLADRLRFGVDDPAATARAFHGWTLWFLGEEEQGCAVIDEALAFVRKEGRAHGLCFALMFAACLHWCRGDVERVAALAGEAFALAKQHRFPLWEGGAGLLLLWARANSDSMEDPGELFRAATMLQQAIPSRVTTSRWMVIHGLLALGEWQEMEKLLDTALREVESLEEQYCLADLLWLKGRCLTGRNADDEAREYYREARDVASRQGAAGLARRFADEKRDKDTEEE